VIKISKIEEIVKARLRDEFDKQVENLSKDFEMRLHYFNNAYESILQTLETLELHDATLFDYFEKTNGNIRVGTVEKRNWDATVDTKINDITLFSNNNIILNKNKTYKIILMAIEENEDNKE